eukprot:Gregarina_sp_Pseudo_9__322@NODE_1209_length_1777_cov_3_729574_g1135_i0_p1_GENE_NODE_1209_length_1777_cov_3_729574_g1135_i0NODE_1209_length_1777_cov_3_729574_g1135_i0_p1_ORF_typecomplete_len338_score83_48PWI/PF01480_17/8_3e10_NODE_1209_length_1777_cov_3_729574_g1135_i0471060
MAAIKARLSDRRVDNTSRDNSHMGRKKSRLLDGSHRDRNQEDRAAKTTTLGVPTALAQRETRRLELVKQRMTDMDMEYSKKSQRWNEDIPAVGQDIQRKYRRFEEAVARAVPSRRLILQMIECDLRGVQYQLSLPYLDTLGRGIHYDVGARELLDSAPREQDEDSIPVSRNWQKKALAERTRMRAIEKKEDAADIEDEAREAEGQKALEARKEELKKRKEQRVPQVMGDNAKPAVEEEATSEEKVPQVDWIALKKSGFLEKEGPLQNWLVSQMQDYVGKDDSAELAEYIMDLLPPEASIVPTEESLKKELAEFLEEESEMFVQVLWRKLASATTETN